MKKRSIESILEENYSRATVFEFFGISYPDYLNKQLGEVAGIFGIDPEVLEESLKQIKVQSPKFDYDFLELPVLIAYLKYTHHEYAKAKLPHIKKNLERLQLKEMLTCFNRFSRDLQKHILLEEKVIFPFINSIHSLLENFEFSKAQKLLNENSTEVLCASHTSDDDEMQQLRQVTSGYKFKEGDSVVYKVLMTDLKRLEKDIHVHASIEDEILFRKAKQSEKQLRERISLHLKNN